MSVDINRHYTNSREANFGKNILNILEISVFNFFLISLHLYSLCALALPVYALPASSVKWLLAGRDAADSITAVVAPQGSYVLENHMGLHCVQLCRHFQSITHIEEGAYFKTAYSTNQV